ncbi:unnamed protein product [Closterium sp. NIES-53]
MAAPSDDDAADADGDPSCSHGPRTGLDFLRGPVSEPAPRPLPEPSDESEGWRYPVRKAAQKSPPHQPEAECDDARWQRPECDEADRVVHDFVDSTEIVSGVPESSNSVALKNAATHSLLLVTAAARLSLCNAGLAMHATGGMAAPDGTCSQASTCHEDCIDRQKGLLDKLAAHKKINDYERADPEGARVTRLMRSIQFVCDKDAPIAMFPRLVEFLAKEGVSDIPQQTYGVYITQYGFTEMVKAMCTYQQQQQLMYIHASPWIGISCDVSTDRSRGKHLVVFATFMKE